MHAWTGIRHKCAFGKNKNCNNWIELNQGLHEVAHVEDLKNMKKTLPEASKGSFLCSSYFCWTMTIATSLSVGLPGSWYCCRVLTCAAWWSHHLTKPCPIFPAKQTTHWWFNETFQWWFMSQKMGKKTFLVEMSTITPLNRNIISYHYHSCIIFSYQRLGKVS